MRKSLDARQSYLRFIHLCRLPNEITLPGAVAWNLVALQEARARGERTGSSISVEGSLLVNTIHVWAGYREAKTIYTIDRALDRLVLHKDPLQQHLRARLGELFKLDYDLLLYDVTSTYFEGEAATNPLALGYSRDHRPDCKQVNIALVVTREGMPVGEAVEAKLVAGAPGEDSYLLCRSTQRRAKEQGMHQRFAARIEAGLARLAGRIARCKRPLERSALDRQIGRLLGANGHAARRYIVELVEDPSCAAGLKLAVSINQQWEQRAALAEGCYVLRTNLTQWDPPTLWRTYIQLTQAEAAFRIHKRDLSLRPFWHQKQSRVEAHILVCFLAYVLWKTLEQWQACAGLGNSPRTILDELGASKAPM